MKRFHLMTIALPEPAWNNTDVHPAHFFRFLVQGVTRDIGRRGMLEELSLRLVARLRRELFSIAIVVRFLGYLCGAERLYGAEAQSA